MPLCFFLLFFLCDSTVNSQSTTVLVHSSSSSTPKQENLTSVTLVATPDYPVAAGQNVDLQCSANIMSVSFSWQHLENETWKEVSNGSDLTLTKPVESGVYSCFAKDQSLHKVTSSNHTVFIISTLPTVGENLGIAAFVFSLLAMMINVAILLWLGWQRFCATLSISNTVAKGLPGPEMAPKESFPQTEGDGDVYMNYRNTNQAYTDLDPANMTVHNVYSTLS